MTQSHRTWQLAAMRPAVVAAEAHAVRERRLGQRRGQTYGHGDAAAVVCADAACSDSPQFCNL